MHTDTVRETSTQAQTPMQVLVARNLSSFQPPPDDDPNELIRYRTVCRGAVLLLAGPTGIGKSSFDLQCGISWALGRTCFGMEPTRPLKSLYIQAENDDGDIWEFREGIFAGLALSEQEQATVCENVVIHLEDRYRGFEFLSNVVEPLLEHHKPDICHIDPALAYLGGDAKEQVDVGKFLRGGIVRLMRHYKCAAQINHHTNKPIPGDRKSAWAPSDFAYLGSGSIEWANTARAVLTLRPIGDTGKLFELRAPKRGVRLGWKDDKGAATTIRYVSHAEGKICWCEPSYDEVTMGKASKAEDQQRAWSILCEAPSGLGSEAWFAACKSEYGWARNKFFSLKSALETSQRLLRDKANKTWRCI